MVRATVPVAFLILMMGLVSGLSFDVNVAEITDHSVKTLNYSEEVEVNQNVTGSIENVGSIGCSYRMKGEFSHGNDTFERYSQPVELWQGDEDELKLNYIPMNYTGIVDTTLSLEYCGQEEEINSFSFNVTENTLPGAEVESRTYEASENQASVEIGSGDLLVPEESPSFWKASSAEITNSSATLEYDAPIFDSSQTITYTVLEDGQVSGSVEVSLKEEPNWEEKLRDKKLEIAAGLLGLSLLVNLLLVARLKGIREKLPDVDLPDFRKDQ